MENVLKYIVSVPVQNMMPNLMNISFGSSKDGKMGVFMQDPAELGMDSSYLNEQAYPNSGLLAFGKYTLWLSMFMRHINTSTSDEAVNEEPDELD